MAKQSNNENDKKKRSKTPGLGKMIIPIIILGMIAVGLGLYWVQSQNSEPQANTGTVFAKVSENPSQGSSSARVVIDEFGDFQCPVCGMFHRQTYRNLDETYVKTGRVKLVFHPLNYIGSESKFSAAAATCAQEQGHFWEYHDKLYESQNGENNGAFRKENLKNFAKELGLDTQAFNHCLDSSRYNQLIDQWTSEGQRRGVTGTPTFFINGRKYPGFLTLDQLRQIIEALQ
ncbi:DsbA family protein [Candidatus Acetothermia bacterium]|nr:DsbA family protein [Candidatus Acetothermia bacterium]MBI3459829.1 DsbA family protein [Candidatus Acetothermia bacterium]